MNEFVK